MSQLTMYVKKEKCGSCVFYYDIGPNQFVTLDLMPLQGAIISGLEEGGSTGFLYAPCDNGVICGNEERMASRKDISDDTCLDNL